MTPDAETLAIAGALLSEGKTDLTTTLVARWAVNTGAVLLLAEQVRDMVAAVDGHGKCTLVLTPGCDLVEAFRAITELADETRADLTHEELEDLREILEC